MLCFKILDTFAKLAERKILLWMPIKDWREKKMDFGTLFKRDIYHNETRLQMKNPEKNFFLKITELNISCSEMNHFQYRHFPLPRINSISHKRVTPLNTYSSPSPGKL